MLFSLSVTSETVIVNTALFCSRCQLPMRRWLWTRHYVVLVVSYQWDGNCEHGIMLFSLSVTNETVIVNTELCCSRYQLPMRQWLWTRHYVVLVVIYQWYSDCEHGIMLFSLSVTNETVIVNTELCCSRCQLPVRRWLWIRHYVVLVVSYQWDGDCEHGIMLFSLSVTNETVIVNTALCCSRYQLPMRRWLWIRHYVVLVISYQWDGDCEHGIMLFSLSVTNETVIVNTALCCSRFQLPMRRWLWTRHYVVLVISYQWDGDCEHGIMLFSLSVTSETVIVNTALCCSRCQLPMRQWLWTRNYVVLVISYQWDSDCEHGIMLFSLLVTNDTVIVNTALCCSRCQLPMRQWLWTRNYVVLVVSYQWDGDCEYGIMLFSLSVTNETVIVNTALCCSRYQLQMRRWLWIRHYVVLVISYQCDGDCEYGIMLFSLSVINEMVIVNTALCCSRYQLPMRQWLWTRHYVVLVVSYQWDGDCEHGIMLFSLSVTNETVIVNTALCCSRYQSPMRQWLWIRHYVVLVVSYQWDSDCEHGIMLFSLSVINETVIVNTASQRNNEQRQSISHAFKSVYGKVRRLFRNFGSCRLFVGYSLFV